MLKRGIIVLVLLTFIPAKFFSQEISHSVLVPLASIADLPQYNVNQTIGEAVVDYLVFENSELTQGFQQPSIDISTPEPPGGTGVDVYPNPVIDIVKIELFGVLESNFQIRIFGLNGTIYHECDLSCGRDYWEIRSIDMSNYKRGMYFIHIASSDGRISRFFKIEKM